MAGIYIHIPFCRKACHYCNFHFSASQKLLPEMVHAICREAEVRKDYLNEAIETIYFGGGTPSLLPEESLSRIVDKLHTLFHINADAEITLETNPDDINKEKLTAYKALGINRLSMGVQSFFDDDLQWMNRAHNAGQARKSIELAQQSGFTNMTIDLIYGTPHLTDEGWLQNLDTALQLKVPHLSCYALTVEPNTALQKMIALHKKEDIDTEKQGRQFEQLMQWSADNRYEHYEISNFATPGYRSRHNSSYWQGKPYVGLGPSAHSYNGASRQWNIANNALYIKSIQQDIIPSEKEELTSTQKINEYIMTALRTAEGIILHHLNTIAGEQTASAIQHDAQKFMQQHLMQLTNEALVLTNKGKLFADGIAADLFRE